MTTVKKRISSHPVTLSIEKHVWKEVKERGQGRVTHNDDHLLRGEKDAHKIQYGLVRGISSVYPHDEDYCHFHSFQNVWGEGGEAMHEWHALSMTVGRDSPQYSRRERDYVAKLSFLVHVESWKAVCVRTSLISLGHNFSKKKMLTESDNNEAHRW